MSGRPVLQGYESLLEGPTPAVLTTYRRDGTAKVSPVWFRLDGDHFEIVIASDDLKLKHLRRDPRVNFLVFETVPPFRGILVSCEVGISSENLDEVRRSITSRYLDDEASKTFTEARRGNGVVVRVPVEGARTWGAR